jgi:hypothetical protein
MTRQSPSSASARTRRQPLTIRNRVSVRNQDPDYVYRVVNDIDNRVEDLVDRGYEIVPQDKVIRGGDKRVDDASALGSTSSISLGRGDRGVVMRIRKDWNAEDQATKAIRADELERTMKSDGKQASDYGYSLTQETSR